MLTELEKFKFRFLTCGSRLSEPNLIYRFKFELKHDI